MSGRTTIPNLQANTVLAQHKHTQHLQATMNPEAYNHNVAAAIVIKSSCKDSLATTRCSFEESST